MDTFTITTTVTFHPLRVPPRCRKPRRVEETFTVTTDIPSVTAADAPVACIFDPGYQRLTHDETDEIALRTFDGSFYIQRRDVNAGDEDFPSERTWESRETDQVAAEREAHGRLWKYLVIDGKVWETIGEPYYSVNTYGTGNNHGGTGLSLNLLSAGQDVSSLDYAATELEAAIDGALEVAEARRDTEYFEHIRSFKGVNVILPEAFRIIPRDMRKTSKEAEVRVVADAMSAALSGPLDREKIRTVREALKELEDIMFNHGIDEVSR
ncbi:hypothetical protein [Arthrobacter caoxuetaonis]|uniref:Uncharacterized protein n=1 Tax=Arthrobacter caoxuetaonis TaxID=2886935 RepID=A0A9X1SDK3_9MICC|nr:hypothetical protein [Arthrobacter caoxuetaonis]MCC3299293.1 hypothetical protein [Arthrobacter caoxuetaonis]USQ59214.1 hypothetical protein NF551_16655 [Arthrobacter caoxuetaonis]